MSSLAPDPAFLANIHWAQAALEFEVLSPIDLPSFPGTTIRGILGDAFKRALCERRPACAHCTEPAACRYFHFFEKSHAPTKELKTFVIDAPTPFEFDAIAHGASVNAPFSADNQTRPPTLTNDHKWRLPEGALLPVGITFLGPSLILLPPIMQLLAAKPIRTCGGEIILRRANDPSSYDRPIFDSLLPGLGIQSPLQRTLAPHPPLATSKIRIYLLSPVHIDSRRTPPNSALSFAQLLLRQSVVRALDVHDFLCHPGLPRLPRYDPPDIPITVSNSRVFRYGYQRVSFRQDRRMPFEGLVGFLDLEGPIAPFLPFLHAAEILHIGQHSTMGHGRIRLAEIPNRTNH